VSDAQTPHVYRQEELRQALAEDPRVNEPELEVTIVDGRVIATGIVPTEERRAAVEVVLRERSGDLAVDNLTTVKRFPPAEEGESVG
jgi:osmotically-inducible protein OsmY